MIQEVVSANNYLKHVTEFVSFLSINEPTLDEILRYMALVLLSPLNVEAITMRQLNSENQAVLVGAWGMSLESLQKYPVAFNLNDRFPTTDTLRYRRTTWVNTLPDWGDDYPLLKELQHNTGAKSFIAFPIEKAGTPVAALGILSRDVIQPNAEIETFLRAAGSVFSMYMFSQDSKTRELLKNQDKHMPSHVESTDNKLTERQQVILRLISEDRTNLTISELLGYSESTVRQETIKIFAKLNCTGRKEATQIYRQQLAKSKEN